MILVVNKWDLVEKNDKTYTEFEKNLRVNLQFMSYAPIVFVSAETKQEGA